MSPEMRSLFFRRPLGNTIASISSSVLPAFGSDVVDEAYVEMKKYVITPYDRRYRWWQTWLVLVVAYSAWASPFEVAFRKVATGFLMPVDLLVDASFAFDIILTFFVAYLDTSTYLLVDHHYKIATRYVKTLRFPMDIASSLPFQVMYKIFTGKTNNGDTFVFLNLLRLWQLRRVAELFRSLENDTRFSYFWTRTLKLACVSLFSVHVAGCIYYWLAVQNNDPMNTWIGRLVHDFKHKSIWLGYTYSIYFSIATLTAVGYGDIHVVNTGERIFNMLHMLFNLGLIACLIELMTVLIVTHAAKKFAQRTAINKMLEFSNKNKLPEALKEQMLANMHLKFKKATELAEEQILEDLPKALRSSIAQHLFSEIVATTYLFRGVSNDLVAHLVTKMKGEYFPPNIDIVLQNEIPTDFYIIVSGEVELVTYKKGRDQILWKLESADMAGEIGVVFNIPQPFTVRTKRFSQVIRMSHPQFKQILQQYNSDGKIIFSNFIQYLKGLNQEIMEEGIPFLADLLGGLNIDIIESNQEPQNCVQSCSQGDTPMEGIAETSPMWRRSQTRVIIHKHLPHKNTKEGDHAIGTLVFLPNSIQELFNLAEKKLGIRGNTICMIDGSEVEELNLLRENDHLFFV